MTQVAIAQSWDYQDALLKLPKAQQGKALRKARRFKRDPSDPSLRYKPVKRARKGIYSFDVDQGYRTIVQDSERGNPYLFLYIGSHDEAYDWACRHRCEVHPETGTLQIFEPRDGLQDGREGIGSSSITEEVQVLFPDLRGRQLQRLGVPEKMILDVQSLTSDPEFEALEDRLPSGVYDALLLLYLKEKSYEELVLDREHLDDTTDLEVTTEGLTDQNRISDLRASELRRLGVPDAMIPEVRTLESEISLDAIRDRLPSDAHEALTHYLAGDKYEDLASRRTPPAKVDTGDVVKALEKPESKQRFWVAENEEELEKVFLGPFEPWRVFLHPKQRALVERHWNGPVYVKGAPGTGKTVVAMHRVKWLVRKLEDDLFRDNATGQQQRILILTFTKNLAADIRANLHSICTRDEMRRIEVTNLDRWVSDFLRKEQPDRHFRLVFNRNDEPWTHAWQQALSHRDRNLLVNGRRLTDSFYADELDHIVLPHEIETEAQYMRVSRKGRGTALQSGQRARVWRVFNPYREELWQCQGVDRFGQAVTNGIEIQDAYRQARSLLENRKGRPYSAVIVDEAQDLGTQAIRLIRAMVPVGHNDLFIVGDGLQRIHGRDRFVLKHCGINIVGRSRKLKVNYRTTAEIHVWAKQLVRGCRIRDLDDNPDESAGAISLTHGPKPEVIVRLPSFQAQADCIIGRLRKWTKRGQKLRNTCIVARTRWERDRIRQALEKAEFDCFVLEKQSATSGHHGIRLATMHRVKGIEFDRMILASVNAGLVPLRRAVKNVPDEEARERAETEERSLVFVAATRARKELVVLSYGTPSPLLSPKADSQGSGVPRGRRSARVRSSYREGDRVIHKTFGTGVVVARSGSGAGEKVFVDFDEVGRKQLVIRLAGLIPDDSSQ